MRRGAASNTSYTGLDLGMLFGPTIGGNVIVFLEPQLGSLVEAYSWMWLVMLVPLVFATIVIIYWNIKGTNY